MTGSTEKATLETIARRWLLWLAGLSRYPKRVVLASIDFLILSLSLWLSVLAQDRMRAIGMAIGTWFFFVLIFDLLLMGLLVLSKGSLDSTVFASLLMLNPADVFRLLNIFSSQQVQTMYGLATVMPDRLTHPMVLTGIMLGWIIGPFLFAKWRFK